MNLPDVRRVKRFLTNDTALVGLEKLLTWVEAQEEAITQAAEDPDSNFSLFRIRFGLYDSEETKKFQEIFGLAITEHWFIWQDAEGRWSVSHRLTGFKAIGVKDRDVAEAICKRLQTVPDMDWNKEKVEELTSQQGYEVAGRLIMSLVRGEPLNSIVLDLPEVIGFNNDKEDKVHLRTLRLRKRKKGVLEPHVEAK